MNRDGESPITMLIPTSGRRALLKWVLESHRDFPGQIIIADGSPEPSSLESGNGKIRYFHVPDDGPLYGSGYLSRLRAAIGLVETPYMLIRADSCFTTNSGISRCL